MGRQVYLTRLAFGRSAFESADAKEVPFPIADRPFSGGGETSECTNSHVQLYDSRGHPVNLRSQELGRQLREAANQVLVAIGAVERKKGKEDHVASRKTRAHPAHESEEDTLGQKMWTLMWTATMANDWFFSFLGVQILVDATRRDFSAIMYGTLRHKSALIRSIPLCILNNLAVPWIQHSDIWARCIDTVVYTLNLNTFSKATASQMISGLLKLITLPIQYHYSLLVLGITSKILPPLEAWRAGSPYCPFPRLDNGWGAVILSPMVVTYGSLLISNLLISGQLDRLYGLPESTVVSAIIRPENVNGSQRAKGTMFRGQHTAIQSLLTKFGWAYTTESGDGILVASGQQDISFDLLQGRISRPAVSMERQQSANGETRHQTQAIASMDSSATIDAASQLSANLEPTVRISSRDTEQGHVELEIHIPEQRPTLTPESSLSGRSHRVTELSRGPTEMAVELVHCILMQDVVRVIPHFLVLNFTALYFFATPMIGSNDANPILNLGFWYRWSQNTSWKGAALIVQNTLLCTGLKYAVIMVQWGVCTAVTMHEGKRRFGWGDL